MFDDGRRLGGHVRQAHPNGHASQGQHPDEGEMAARVLEMWREGTDPSKVVLELRVHPRFVRGVLREYDELLNEWKKVSVAGDGQPVRVPDLISEDET
jgi:hypothetical protein